MIIGVLLSGIFTGLAVTIGALSFGFPLWLAVALYPIVGTFGAVAFIGLMMSREKGTQHQRTAGFATEYR